MPSNRRRSRLRFFCYPAKETLMVVISQEVRDMIVVMQSHASPEDVQNVVEHVKALGYRAHISQGEETTIIGVIGHSSPDQLASLEFLPGVDHMVPVMKPYKLGSRDFRPSDTVVSVDGVQ